MLRLQLLLGRVFMKFAASAYSSRQEPVPMPVQRSTICQMRLAYPEISGKCENEISSHDGI